MDGIHDLGGLAGFGAVVRDDDDERVFASEWERRVFGMTFAGFVRGDMANGGQWRHTIERMDPVHYLTTRYYEHWLTAVATRVVETGVLTLDELEARAGGRVPLARPEATGLRVDVATRPQRFATGDAVRVLDDRPAWRGHTRCPRYARGRTGVVVRVDPAASVPDVEAHSSERCIESVYCVRFDAADLWADAEPGVHVHVDLWDRYLEAA